jgi:hypothetical protein
MMEAQTIINILIAVVCGGMGWWLNTMYRAHETLRREVSAIAVALPTTYVTKADLHDIRDALFARFDRLELKLDRKADK